MAGLLSSLRTETIAAASTNVSRVAVEEIRVFQSLPGTRERIVTQTGAGSAVIHHIVQTGGWLSSGRISPGWMAALLLNHGRNGGFTAQGCTMGPGRILLYGPGATHLSCSKGAADITWVFLPLEALRNCWPVSGGRGMPGCEKGSWILAVEPVCLQDLCRVINTIGGAATFSEPLQASGDSSEGLEKELFEAFIEVAVTAAAQPVHTTREENITAAAMNYIYQHGMRTIYVKELCSICAVRERVLQRAFKTMFQVSPMRYLKLRRLHAARAALLQAGDCCSVKRAALEAGFSELGRFAGEYCQVFGASPSATLKGPRAE